MIPFFKLIGILFVTTLAMVALTELDENGNAAIRLGGLPIVSVAQDGARGVIALGQTDARGIITIAQAGMGLIAFCQGGIGILFFLGQGGGGLLAITQVGVGLIFFLGQLGLGMNTLGQAAAISHGTEFMNEMHAEFKALLSYSDNESTVSSPAQKRR